MSTSITPTQVNKIVRRLRTDSKDDNGNYVADRIQVAWDTHAIRVWDRVTMADRKRLVSILAKLVVDANRSRDLHGTTGDNNSSACHLSHSTPPILSGNDCAFFYEQGIRQLAAPSDATTTFNPFDASAVVDKHTSAMFAKSVISPMDVLFSASSGLQSLSEKFGSLPSLYLAYN
jgi:hypothetical protein